MGDDETAALRERVRQLEAMITAMRGGELDAVLGTRDTGSIYTLESEERPYRLMVERMAEGALTVDEDGRILYCNQAFAALVRRRLGSVMGRRFVDFLPDSEHELASQLVRLEGSVRLDAMLRSPDGVVPVAIAATAIESPDGNTTCVIVSDLRQRRIAERLRRKQAALVIEAQRKDEFIAMLGHELRNPLAPIQHAAELLSLDDLEPARLAAVRTTILRQIAHVKRLVDDLLDISRITRGSLRVERVPMDARPVIESAVELTHSGLEGSARDLTVELPDEPVPIEGDPVRLTQVVTNLLNNALKFTDDGDAITVRLETVGDKARFVVSDTGRGIEPEMLSTIFQAFVQQNVVFDSAVGGLGLGLALVKRIVELHEGDVRAASEGPGRGATFTIDLPLADAVRLERAARAEAKEADSTAPRRILVCDDNVDAAEMLGMLLETAGHEVVTVHTGEDALRVAAEEPPDVVFLDIGLPGLDGYEVARQLRANPETGGTIIVALTGYGQPEDREAAVAAGCDLHLVKPVDRAAIATALAHAR